MAVSKKSAPTLEEMEARAQRRGDKESLKLIAAIRKADKKHKNPLHVGSGVPKVGDEIYVGGAMYIDHGQDDIAGGLAEVVSVTDSISAGMPTPFIEVKELPGHSYNWEHLATQQEEYKKRYGRNRAHPDPDFG